jgi:hypothetical protein
VTSSGPPPRAVLDTDVLFSRVLHELLGRVASELRLLTLLWSDELLAEAARTLIEHKGLSTDAASRWVGYLREAFPDERINLGDLPASPLTGMTSTSAPWRSPGALISCSRSIEAICEGRCKSTASTLSVPTRTSPQRSTRSRRLSCVSFGPRRMSGAVDGRSRICSIQLRVQAPSSSRAERVMRWPADQRWRGPESNWRHHDFQSCALPTELPRRNSPTMVAAAALLGLRPRVWPSGPSGPTIRQ